MSLDALILHTDQVIKYKVANHLVLNAEYVKDYVVHLKIFFKKVFLSLCAVFK